MRNWWERLRLALGHGPRTIGLPDLRDLPSAPARVRGTHYLVHDPERERKGDRTYVLRRESGDRRDASAIAVYAGRRSVGFVSPHRAEPIAPLLDRMGGAAVVNGLGSETGSIRLWVDLPRVDVLSHFVHEYEVSVAAATEPATAPV